MSSSPDEKTTFAVRHALEIIGEAVKHILMRSERNIHLSPGEKLQEHAT